MERIEEGVRVARPTVVTIGNFDGVHLGHRHLLARAQAMAEGMGRDLVVVTFDPPPRTVLEPEATGYVITAIDIKLELLADLGVRWVKVLQFTPEFSRIPAKRFLEEELGEKLQVQGIVVGQDFSFGHRGRGTPALLRAWGASRRVAVEVVEAVADEDGTAISSSRVRAAVRRGDLAAVEELLGRPLQVCGHVVSGAGRGRQIGVPTANVPIDRYQVMPPYGIYAGEARVGHKRKDPAVASWGVRPTFGDLTQPLLEVHLIDTDVHLRGELLTFQFGSWLREERNFSEVDELVRQMQEDIVQAKARY